MPRKPHSSDWNRLFGPRAQRRRGPIGLLVFTSLAGLMIAALALMGQFGYKAYAAQNAELRVTATVAWATAYARQTTTAVAKAIQPTATATTASIVETAQVITVGNLRAEPRIAEGNIQGQLLAGDQVEVLARDTDANPQWLRVRVTTTTGQVKVASEGWVSVTVVQLAEAAK